MNTFALLTDRDERNTREVLRLPDGWAWPDMRFLRSELPKPPELPLNDVLPPRAAEWVAATAECAGAPADYVLTALLCLTGATVGNSRWVSPWRGWAEPPIIWGMCIGNPSAGKSPAIDAVLTPLRRAERPLREAADLERAEWEQRQKLAKLAEGEWEKKARAAISKGTTPPSLPEEANAGAEPHMPRLIVNDGTVEKLGVIAQNQPKGFLQMRDELAGWLLTMETRNGGADRPFWLEAFGGRGFTVERMGRSPLTISRLAIGVVGGIQPDRLNELLTKANDDGLLARFLPVWPARAPIKQPDQVASDALVDAAMSKLTAMQMPLGEDGDQKPGFVGFDGEAQRLMNEWRNRCAEWEDDSEGLLLSFVGKLPGMAARLSLVLAAIGYAFDDHPEPMQRQITPIEFSRACLFLEEYALPMARRAYGTVSTSKNERAGQRLVHVLREKGLNQFNAREILQAGRKGLASADELNPAITALEKADIIRAVSNPPRPRGGRPQRLYDIHPFVHEVTI